MRPTLVERVVCRTLENDLSWVGLGWLRPKAPDQLIPGRALLQIIALTGLVVLVLGYLALTAALVVVPFTEPLRSYVPAMLAVMVLLNALAQAGSVAIWNRRARRLARDRQPAEADHLPTAAPMLMLALLWLTSGAAAQAVVGGDVVLAGPEVTLKIGKRVVATGEVHRVFHVERENGKWLWVTAPELAGWVHQDQVLPLDVALDRRTKAIETKPSPSAYNARGLLLADLGRGDQALADFDEAIRLDPSYGIAHLNRGLLNLGRGRLDLARPDLDRAVALAPLNPLAYYNRGRLHLMENDYAAARADFTHATELAPGHAASWFNHAVTSLIAGDPGQAAASAQIYLRVAGWNEALSPYAVLIGWVGAMRAGQIDLAVSLLRRGLESCDHKPFSYMILRHMADEVELAELIAAAPSLNDAAEAREYGALRLEALEQPSKAVELHRWVVAHSDPARVPHALATAALKAAPPGDAP